MQCPSCHFHNMPGSGHCARCGASLRLSGPIDVHPPRAGTMQKRLPTLYRLPAAWRRVTGGLLAGLAGAFGLGRATTYELPRGLLGWIIPGRAQRQRGDRPRAAAYLVIYAGTLLLGISLAGTLAGSVLLGLAFTAHVAALLDGIAGSFATASDRVRLAALLALGLAAGIYGPALWAGSRVVTPVRVFHQAGPFAAGDVVWYSRLASVDAGDFVLYDVTPVSATGRTATGQAARFEIEGRRINRVVARGGQRVAVRSGQVYVDDALCRWQPRQVPPAAIAQPTVVPVGSYYVLPEDLVPLGAEQAINPWTAMSVVSARQVAGPVVFRSYPWSRLAVVD